ncbi:helix-turn-helix transcriptional regulator [Streptacidiphilus sp. N1-10]|uniref:Helix-turn-helix transcriptional regulator n=1 Tax=Streptacidiphilus jeojiensis TaxID=3229225 RepID=A0ABV6XI83_9ACTN
MTTSPSSSMQQARDALGLRLRELRLDAGLTARELARRCGWHESKCSRIEHGRMTPSDADLRAWAEECDALDQVVDLVAVARGIAGMYIEWRRSTRNGLRYLQEAGMPLYDRTRHFQVYEPGTIPGLFQTREYASALMGSVIAFHGMPDDLDAAVAARMVRQRVVSEGDHRIAVLLEESALRARIGGEAAMVGQLAYLLTVGMLTRVSLGIIPAAADRTMWPTEGFWIFDDERVLVELVSAEITVTQPREILLYQRTFAELAQIAVYGAPARQLITAAIDALG